MRWLYRPNFSLKNNSKVLFINFPTVDQKEIPKSYKKIKIRKKSSFLYLFYSKLCYPRGQGFKSDTEGCWITKSVSFILKEEESFITNCIAFPGLRKEHFHFAFFSSAIKNKPSKHRTQTQLPKGKKPSNPLSRHGEELRLLYL